MRNVQFSPTAIEELRKFKSGNQNLAFKVFELITDIQSTPFLGLGKPEGLKGNYQGFWSRRINDEHRLIYTVTDELIIIHSCFGHY
jgi:toxin YoeB